MRLPSSEQRSLIRVAAEHMPQISVAHTCLDLKFESKSHQSSHLSEQLDGSSLRKISHLGIHEAVDYRYENSLQKRKSPSSDQEEDERQFNRKHIVSIEAKMSKTFTQARNPCEEPTSWRELLKYRSTVTRGGKRDGLGRRNEIGADESNVNSILRQ